MLIDGSTRGLFHLDYSGGLGADAAIAIARRGVVICAGSVSEYLAPASLRSVEVREVFGGDAPLPTAWIP